MRLLLKHILRTVRRAPLQPLLIFLTVAMATAVSVTAFRSFDMFREYAQTISHKDIELGDITLSLRGDSEVRMLFCEDAEAVIGENAEVFGEYGFTVFCQRDKGMEVLSASAVDLISADRYFQFTYLDYGQFNTQNEDRSVILSAHAAQQLGVGVGDTVVLRVLDTDLNYTVQAIAHESGLLNERDVLVPISSLVQILAARVPTVASLGDGFRPYNRLLIRATEGQSVQSVFSALQASGSFADYRIGLTASDVQMEYTVLVETVSVSILALLLIMLSGMLIGTSLNLLRTQRSMEYALFCSAGASRARLTVLQFTESWLYAILGGGVGVVLAAPMLNFVHGLFDWHTQKLYVDVSGIAFGMLFSLILMTVCTAVHQRRQRLVPLAVWLQEKGNEEYTPQTPKQTFLLPLILTVLFVGLTLVFPVTHRYLPGGGVIFCLVWLLYAIVSPWLRMMASGAERLLERASHPIASLLLAIKNIRNHAAVRHTGCLLGVLLSLLLAVSVCADVVDKQLVLSENVILADLVAANLPPEQEAVLRADPAVEGCVRFDFGGDAELENGYAAMVLLISGDAETCILPDFLPQKTPQGNEAAISSGVAELIGADVGDDIKVILQGVTYTVTVYEIKHMTPNIVFLDIETIDTVGEMVGIKLTDEAIADPTVSAALIAKMETQGATMLESNSITGTIDESLGGFLSLLRWTIIAALVLTLMGGCNVIAEQYRARRHERHLLRISGMDGKTLYAMYAAELLIVAFVAAVLAVIFGGFLCIFIDFIMRSFGYVLFS